MGSRLSARRESSRRLSGCDRHVIHRDTLDIRGTTRPAFHHRYLHGFAALECALLGATVVAMVYRWGPGFLSHRCRTF